MNLYARAYVRGLNADLVAAGSVVYPSKIAMDIAADAVAEHMLKGVDFLSMTDGVPTKIASDAVSGLLQISDDLCQEAGGVYAPALTKAASAADGYEVARYEALQLLKLAEDAANNPGMTDPVSTGHASNPVMTNSAPNASETGVAVDAPQKTDGADGVPASAVTGTEHAIGGHGTAPVSEKLASAARRLTAKLAASGAANPVAGANVPKNIESATGEPSKVVDKANPAEGVPAAAVEGEEMAQKTAAYLNRVEKIAAAVIPYLPAELPEYAQLAHLRSLSKLASFDQGKYLYLVYNAYGIPDTQALGFAQEYVKRASDMGVDEGEADTEGKDAEGKDSDTDDGSSDEAVAEALEAAANEIEEGKATEEAAENEKTASIDRSLGRLRATMAR